MKNPLNLRSAQAQSLPEAKVEAATTHALLSAGGLCIAADIGMIGRHCARGCGCGMAAVSAGLPAAWRR